MIEAPESFNRICSSFRKGIVADLKDLDAIVRHVVVTRSKPEERPELKHFVDYVLTVPFSEEYMDKLYYRNSPDYDFIPIKGFYILLSKALE